MKKIKVAIIREGKIPHDKRVPLIPAQCKQAITEFGNIDLVVQPSAWRAFKDEEFIREGIVLQEDVNDADILIGIKEVPFKETKSIGSLSVRFDESYLKTPGFIYLVLQQLYFQNLNVVELTSTATELIIYLSEDEVQLAFDTLYSRFRKK